MPSGSHRGSSESHRSGGSSRGSSSWGGSSRSSSSRSSSSYSSGGRYYGGGGYYYGGGGGATVSPKVLLLIFLFFSGIVALIFGVIKFANSCSFMSKIKEDYNYYQAMIKKAEKDPDNLIVTGTVTDMFYGSGGRYYITYKIPYSYSGLEGYSYSVYSMEEAYDLLNSTIEIAVNTYPISYSTDSIPMDYKGMSLSRDGEYKKTVGSIFISIGIFAGGGLLIALAILIIVKTSKKKKKEEKKEETISSSQTVIETPKAPEYVYCAYCGAKRLKSKTECDSCGSKLHK